MKSVLILSMNPNAYAPKKLEKAFTNLGLEVVNKDFYEVSVEIGKEVSFVVNNTSFTEFDLLLMRNPTQTAHMDFDYYYLRQSIAIWANENGKRVLNCDLYIRGLSRMDKLSQTVYMSMNGIPVINSTFGDVVKNMKFPVIYKTIMGSHGLGVKKVKSGRGKDYFINVLGKANIIQQPFLESGEDFRVIVLGGRVLGAMKRIAQEGEYLTNISAGGRFEEAELTEELKEISLRVASVFGVEYCGVDIMYDREGNPFVLEVNDSAQFTGFEKATGVDVAGEVANYLLRK